MFTENSMHSSSEGKTAPRVLNTPEFIDRLAQELRAQGDVDLPHSYYVEQVKLRLSGQKTENTPAERTQAPYETSDCFRAWALGE